MDESAHKRHQSSPVPKLNSKSERNGTIHLKVNPDSSLTYMHTVAWVQVDVGSARIPYKDIVTNQERAAYMLSSQEEDKVYIASQANGNCGKGMKVSYWSTKLLFFGCSVVLKNHEKPLLAGV